MKKEFPKKYFIDVFKKYISNDDKLLSKKRTPSIRELLNDYIEIHNDISRNRELEKLEHSRMDFIKALKFFIENSIYIEHEQYQLELKTLSCEIAKIENLKGNEKLLQYTRIYNFCTALEKKFNKENIYAIINEIAKNLKNYSMVDKTIEVIISELLYDGYSLKYLNDWYKKVDEDSSVYDILLPFKELSKSKSRYVFYIKIFKLDNYQFEKEIIVGDIILTQIKQSNLSSECDKYLDITKMYTLFRVEVDSMDMYKGLDYVVTKVMNYFQMINYLENTAEPIIFQKVIVELTNKEMIKLRLEDYDDDILFHAIEKREKQDIQDFVKYRDLVYNKNIKSDEIINIQRALNLVISQKNQLSENRIINLWAVLESILTFHEGTSIIGKVKDVIPKLISMYTMKDKLNIFWSRLNEIKKSDRTDIVNDFINQCKRKDDEYQYEIKVLINMFKSEGEKLLNKFDFNEVLKKTISEIGYFINCFDNRKKIVENNRDEVKNDLIRIYRARNVLIHSGHRSNTNLDNKALRLYQYNIHLLGCIIYFKNKNPKISIAEVLNSINCTYDLYIENIGKEDVSEFDLFKPRYIFL